VAAAGIDTMKIALRAATHLDFTEFAPTPPSSRYGAIVASYYTLAWFDRYLRGDPAAIGRLTATTFDGSADLHYISGGTFDPATGGNLPAAIAGRPVADRLSFHFRSAWSLDGARCEDIRTGCPALPAAPAPRRPCVRPHFSPRRARVRNGRTVVRPRIRCRGRARRVLVRLRAGNRRVQVVAGDLVRIPIGPRLRVLRVSFAVDGRRHRRVITFARKS
jgi:hypothetical protein